MKKKEKQVQRQIEGESEADWVEISAECICAMVAMGEPKFRKEDQARQKAVANLAAAAAGAPTEVTQGELIGQMEDDGE